MMAWTDRHCRYLHRLFAPQALLFTEMVTAGALLHGQQWHLLDHHPAEYPLAVQLGGSDPAGLAECAVAVEERGFKEVNLNVGCPSDRVQRGTFGACLMAQPERVAECVAAMRQACTLPVTIKCRLGVDDADSDELLDEFIRINKAAGCQRFYVHARKAILNGLSPAQNRSIPPLRPERVARVKANHPELQIIINGGIDRLELIAAHLKWADGVMIGRAAYHNPNFLAAAHAAIFDCRDDLDLRGKLTQYRTYMVAELERGTRLHAMTRHLLTAVNGRPGARRFRQVLSDATRLKANNIALFDEAVALVFDRADQTVFFAQPKTA